MMDRSAFAVLLGVVTLCISVSSCSHSGPSASQLSTLFATIEREQQATHAAPDASALAREVVSVGPTEVVSPGPKYMVEAVEMYVVDETGLDFWGSDEVIVGFCCSGVRYVYTSVFEDMDAGDTRAFPSTQSCIWPTIDPDGLGNTSWICDPQGASGPIAFSIQLFDYDPGWLHFVNFITFGGFCTGPGCTDARHHSTYIGGFLARYTDAELAAAMPNPGDTHSETLLIDPCSWPITAENANCGYSNLLPIFGVYRVTIRITRTPDQVAPNAPG